LPPNTLGAGWEATDAGSQAAWLAGTAGRIEVKSWALPVIADAARRQRSAELRAAVASRHKEQR
jgi:hypothetical protein